MVVEHRVTSILPCHDIQASQTFYERLGLAVVSDFGNYRILSDGNGWHLHLRSAEEGWVTPERNPQGIYIYVDDVDAVAVRVQDIIIEPDGPAEKPWGMYEFAISDPDGVLVRIGRPII